MGDYPTDFFLKKGKIRGNLSVIPLKKCLFACKIFAADTKLFAADTKFFAADTNIFAADTKILRKTYLWQDGLEK